MGTWRITGLGACVLGFVAGCLGDPECEADAECPDGQLCIIDSCERPCTEDAECGDDEVCRGIAYGLYEAKDTTYCGTGCREHADCAAGEACMPTPILGYDECGPGCRSDADCDDGTFCSLSQCEPGCGSDAACDDGEYCLQDLSMSIAVAKPVRRCEPLPEAIECGSQTCSAEPNLFGALRPCCLDEAMGCGVDVQGLTGSDSAVCATLGMGSLDQDCDLGGGAVRGCRLGASGCGVVPPGIPADDSEPVSCAVPAPVLP